MDVDWGFCEMVVYLTASLRSAPGLVVIRLLAYVASPGVQSIQSSTYPSIYCAIPVRVYRAIRTGTKHLGYSNYRYYKMLLAVKKEGAVARDTGELSWCACSDLHLICSFARRASFWLHASVIPLSKH